MFASSAASFVGLVVVVEVAVVAVVIVVVVVVISPRILIHVVVHVPRAFEFLVLFYCICHTMRMIR